MHYCVSHSRNRLGTSRLRPDDSGQRYSHKENNMAEGLITDVRLLLSRFENLKSVRFERFCEVWREMNFSLIHWYACNFSLCMFCRVYFKHAMSIELRIMVVSLLSL